MLKKDKLEYPNDKIDLSKQIKIIIDDKVCYDERNQNDKVFQNIRNDREKNYRYSSRYQKIATWCGVQNYI